MKRTTNHGLDTIKHFGCVTDGNQVEIVLGTIKYDDRKHLIQIVNGKQSGLKAGSEAEACYYAGRENAIQSGIEVIDFV